MIRRIFNIPSNFVFFKIKNLWAECTVDVSETPPELLCSRSEDLNIMTMVAVMVMVMVMVVVMMMMVMMMRLSVFCFNFLSNVFIPISLLSQFPAASLLLSNTFIHDDDDDDDDDDG